MKPSVPSTPTVPRVRLRPWYVERSDPRVPPDSGTRNYGVLTPKDPLSGGGVWVKRPGTPSRCPRGQTRRGGVSLPPVLSLRPLPGPDRGYATPPPVGHRTHSDTHADYLGEAPSDTYEVNIGQRRNTGILRNRVLTWTFHD